MSMFHSLSTVLGVAAVSQPAAAWWCYGHVIVAEIARQSVTDEVNEKVDDYMAFLREKADFTKCGPNYVACACWADDLKSDGLFAMAQWHFINIPVFEPSDYVPPGGRPTVWLSPDDGNVARKIDTLEQTAGDGGHPDDTRQKRHHQKKHKRSRQSHPNTWEMSFAVANLIHFFGDIHQPLHAATLYSSTFPTGDEGGNLFNVTANGSTVNELHAVWDSVCLTHTEELTRPLTASTTASVARDAKALIQEYKPTFTDQDIHVYQGLTMANESWEKAVTSSYLNGTLKPNAELTAENYLTQCIKVARSQLTLAGLRLGSEFTYLFGEETNNKNKKQKVISAEHDAETMINNLRQRYGYEVLSPVAEMFLRNSTHFKYNLA